MLATYHEAKRLGYPATRFFQMLTEKGARATAKILLAGDEHKVSDGFTAMWERGRLDLTVEAICSQQRYRMLFTEQELETARKRLDNVDYRISETGAGAEKIQDLRREILTTSKAQPKQPDQRLRVFLCHSSGDKVPVRKLYKRLKNDGFAPWLDEEDLIPGQNWRQEIPKAVSMCHVVLVCLSLTSVNKEGFVQKEIKIALDVADEKPEGTIFIIPARLDESLVPDRLSHCHWVNLFEESGYPKLVHALNTRSKELGILVASPHSVTISNVQPAPSPNESIRRRVAEEIATLSKGDLGKENVEALGLLAEAGIANDAYVLGKLRQRGMAQGSIMGFFEGLSNRTPFVLRGHDHNRNVPTDHRTWTINPEYRQAILHYFAQSRKNQ